MPVEDAPLSVKVNEEAGHAVAVFDIALPAVGVPVQVCALVWASGKAKSKKKSHFGKRLTVALKRIFSILKLIDRILAEVDCGVMETEILSGFIYS